MPEQGPVPEAEQGHQPGLLQPRPRHGDDPGVEGEAVDLPTLLDHGIEHQLSPRATESKKQSVSSSECW